MITFENKKKCKKKHGLTTVVIEQNAKLQSKENTLCDLDQLMQ